MTLGWIFVGLLATSPIVSSNTPPTASDDIRGPIVFGGDANYPPFEFIQEGTPRGFNIDLARAIARDGDLEARHELGNWSEILAGLERGTVDVVPMFYSDERARRFLFTQPFYQARHSIYASSDTPPVYTIEELKDSMLAVEERSFAHDKARSELSHSNLLLTRNTPEALMALEDGRAEYAILAVDTADILIYENGLDIERLGRSIWPIKYAFAVRNDRPELQDWLSRHLGNVILNGEYELIHDKWESELEGRYKETERIIRFIGLGLAPLLALVFLVFIWNRQLQRKVMARTKDLESELEKRRDAQEELRYLSDYDPQTNLPKLHTILRLVRALISDSARSGRPRFEVLIFQLVDIGRITQTFGYDVAGQYVEKMAERVRKTETLTQGYVGRGAFVVVAEEGLDEDFMESISDLIPLNGLELQPNLIGGSAGWPKDAAAGEELVRCAETALAYSLERTRRWLPYHQGMAPNPEDARIIMDFRKTRGRDLTAAYQAQIDLRSRQVIAAEALVRWVHPDLGFISPASFIPLLEKTGLVDRVTEIMLSNALQTAHKLRSNGTPLRIGVNVSAHDLMETDLVGKIHATLAETGGLAEDLKIELTETSVAADPTLAKDILSQLSEMGVAISLDDFGTGFSSLAHLSNYPIDEIKIDRAFVSDMLTNRNHASIVRSTIKMAHELGKTVVAEGAETIKVVEALIEEGCDSVQGYYYSKPLAESDFFEYLKGFSK